MKTARILENSLAGCYGERRVQLAKTVGRDHVPSRDVPQTRSVSRQDFPSKIEAG